MKKYLFSAAFLFAALLYSQSAKFVAGEILVKIKDDQFSRLKINTNEKIFGLGSLDELNRKFKLQEIQSIGNTNTTKTFLLKLDENVPMESILARYSTNDAIEFAEPNYIAEVGGKKFDYPFQTLPNDTYFMSRQWGFYNRGTFSLPGLAMGVTEDADVDMELAWDLETGDPNMVIAVSDSGLRLTHEDIKDRVWKNSMEIPEDGIDNDNNGYIDDLQGWDWANNDNHPFDDHGHGTNCTGIIGVTSNNAKGYAGVNWNSKMMVLKSLAENGTATFAAMASSLYYAADNGAKIVSMSLGGSSTSTAISNAINYMKTKNVMLVACMMNFNDDVPYYPAAYSLIYDNVVAVGSTDADDKRTSPFSWSPSSGSNYGSHLNVVAPGQYIFNIDHFSDTGYDYYWGGTSQATPLVAGIASLVFAANPSLTPSQVRDILQTTAEDQKGRPNEDTPGFDIYHGWGRVNAYAAIQKAKQMLGTDATTSVQNAIKMVNPLVGNSLEFDSTFESKILANLDVLSFDGKLVYQKEVKIQKGLNRIPITTLPEGNYIITIKSNDYTKSFKLTKK